MTKETRVGLLVGLVIVIVFGMILTEFKGTSAPFEDVTAQPVIETDYYQAADPPQPALAFSPSPQQAEHAIHLASADNTPPSTEPIRIRVLPRTPAHNTAPVSATIRRNIDEELLASRTNHENPQPVQLEPQPQRQPAPAQARAASKKYRVVEGDTLSRIAKKVYGEDKGHLYTKIFDANRNQLSDASSIYVGQVLTIPAPAANTQRQANGTRQVDLEGLQQYVRQPRTTTRRVYVVQSGDSLTRIARKVFNDGSNAAVNRLFEANKDKLESPDNIIEGMTLRIPS